MPTLEIRPAWEDVEQGLMLCAAIDIGSNTTRVLVAEPSDGQLKKVMEQRAYTRISKAVDARGAITPEKVDEVAELVATQVRLARESYTTAATEERPPPEARMPLFMITRNVPGASRDDVDAESHAATLPRSLAQPV